MRKVKKIVFIGFLPGFGGAEKSMIMVANGLVELGNEVFIISMKENNVVYDIDYRITYIFIPDQQLLKLNLLMNRYLDLRKVLVQIKPDIVISFWLQPAIFASLISKNIKFKTIYSERTDPTAKQYSGFSGFLKTVFFKFFDGFVFQTEGAKNCFSKAIQSKGTVINNPVYINYDDYEFPKVRRKVIVNVGRLHEQKNQKLLINSFAKITNLFPEYTLEIYGEGSLKGDLEEQIKELKLCNMVQLKGTTNKLYDEIVTASLFVLSSDYEGMPNALMEAMALGIPCISTDCKPGGARELIDNGKNGFIVARGSDDELAKYMRFILHEPQKSEIIGYNSKQICNTHSKERIFMMWEEYITQVIRGAQIDD